MSFAFKISEEYYIGGDNPCFIIAEIGQNHQGSLLNAKKLIEFAKECGADCVKFQKTDLPSRFNKQALERPYVSKNSWGFTYGEHRKHLELTEQQFYELQNHANSLGILFSSSGMDKLSLDFINKMDVPFLKIGSGDANNFPLLQYASTLGKPLFISTGMQTMETVAKIYKTVKPLNTNLALFQCTSSYPTPLKESNVNVIKTYKKEFPKAVIGYSGHEKGMSASLAAVALGAKILERHITMDYNLKGTDHIASLDVMDFASLVKQVREIETALGSSIKSIQLSEQSCKEKLGKCIVASKNIPAGSLITADMLVAKVADPRGIPAEKMEEILSCRTVRDVLEDASIQESDLY